MCDSNTFWTEIDLDYYQKPNNRFSSTVCAHMHLSASNEFLLCTTLFIPLDELLIPITSLLVLNTISSNLIEIENQIRILTSTRLTCHSLKYISVEKSVSLSLPLSSFLLALIEKEPRSKTALSYDEQENRREEKKLKEKRDRIHSRREGRCSLVASHG